MKIYLVRHGKRDGGENYDKLTSLGIEQSKRIGLYFKNKKIDFIYCSPQNRAKQTLKYIKPFLNKSAKIEISDYMKQQGIPDEVGEDVIKKFKIKKETDKQTQKRVSNFLNIIKKKYKNNTLLFVTHKKFITFSVYYLLKLSKKDQANVYIPSGSITYFYLDNNKVKDYEIASTSHLIRRLK